MFPLQAGAPRHWDHPGSQEHTCHCAGAQPAAYTDPTVPAATPVPRTGFTVGKNQDHPNSSSNRSEEGEKVLFRGSSLRTPRVPSPGDARPAADLSLPPGSAPSQTRGPSLPPPAGRSPPGVRLPSLFQFGGGVWGCSGHCRRRRLRCRHSRSRRRSAARRAAGAEGWGPAGSRERGTGARRGRAARSCRREARRERGASHPRPSSHNFAAWVGAGSGWREARAGRGRWGGSVLGAGRTGT